MTDLQKLTDEELVDLAWRWMTHVFTTPDGKRPEIRAELLRRLAHLQALASLVVGPDGEPGRLLATLEVVILMDLCNDCSVVGNGENGTCEGCWVRVVENTLAHAREVAQGEQTQSTEGVREGARNPEQSATVGPIPMASLIPADPIPIIDAIQKPPESAELDDEAKAAIHKLIPPHQRPAAAMPPDLRVRQYPEGETNGKVRS
jgi:hypothetical protein